MSSIGLLIILAFYLGLLFLIAHWSEHKKNVNWTNSPYIYSLSLAIYCTAWTYYGSIGVAAKSGLSYLAVYVGPIIIIPAWIVVLRKIIRIARVNKISSLSDFISLRYGNSRFLGALVTFICISGIIPYIALQLKAISETFHITSDSQQTDSIFKDLTTYIALLLAIFTSFYGTRYLDTTEKRKGIVTAVALESFLKLLFFVVVGVYVTFFVFDGFQDIYNQASQLEGFHQKNSFGSLEAGINWFLLSLLSLFAIFLLPRQFHVSVTENNREKHLKTAIWLFPLYLLVFNFFVYPVAWGGNVLFDGQSINADFYSLYIPQFFNHKTLTVIVFLGGFSAAISMIVISTISLSIMLSNNLLIPYGLLGKFSTNNNIQNSKQIVNVRKFGIFTLIIASYLVYRFFVLDYTLVSIGLISFVIIAQLAPSFFSALFWKRGSKKGVIIGLLLGMTICAYTLLIPYLNNNAHLENSYINQGPFGINFLKPFALFGLNYLEPIPHALFWSLFFNTASFAIFSVSFKGDYRERNYAEMYVDIDKHINQHEKAYVWKGTAYKTDIIQVLNKFLGEDKTKRALKIFNLKYDIPDNIELADARFIKFSENLLTGSLGTVSAKILISNVIKEDKISLKEVIEILEESQENISLNKKLTETSRELQKMTEQLKKANEELQQKDQQKDEFLNMVTHELRTPITAIKATSEILKEDHDIPEPLEQQFFENIISEADRLNRLIDKILDLEKLKTQQNGLQLKLNTWQDTIHKAVNPLQNLIEQHHIKLNLRIPNKNIKQFYDEERMIQVINNLMSNAIKHAHKANGLIEISLTKHAEYISFSVFNEGNHIPKEDISLVFDKFFQSSTQGFKKKEGTGLGLSIAKEIIEQHQGTISVENHQNGVKFSFNLPL